MPEAKKPGRARSRGRNASTEASRSRRVPTQEEFEAMPKTLGVAEPTLMDDYATIMTLRPELGFVKDNIAFVRWRCARIAEAGNPSELRQVANFLDRYRATGEELRTIAGDLRQTAEDFERRAEERNDTSRG